MEERNLYNNTCFKPMAYEQLQSFKRKSFFSLVIDWPANAVRERHRLFSSFLGNVLNVSGNEDVPSGLVDIGKGSKMPPNFSMLLAN